MLLSLAYSIMNLKVPTQDGYGTGYQVLIFFAPKPGFSSISQELLAWRKVMQETQGNVVLLLNNDADKAIARKNGFIVEKVDESESGLPLLSSILRTMSLYQNSCAVAFANSDLSPGENFGRSLISLLQFDLNDHVLYRVDDQLRAHVLKKRTRGWLVVASRFDYIDKVGLGHIHLDGGVDFWLWNNIPHDNNIFGVPSTVPDFRLARPWFDNWLTSTALQVAGRHIIDGTLVFRVNHKMHSRLGSIKKWDDPKIVRLLENDYDWLQNSHFAQERVLNRAGVRSKYRLGIGTTCESKYYLNYTPSHDDKMSLKLQVRDTLMPCPSCTHCYYE